MDKTMPCPSYTVELEKDRIGAAIRSFFSMRTYREWRFNSRKFELLVNKFLLEDSFDAIWIGALDLLIYVRKLLSSRKQQNLPVLVLDHQNADEIVWYNAIKHGDWLLKFFATWEIFKLRRFQARWLHWLDVILVMTEEEKEVIIRYIDSATKMWLVPSGVDLNYFQPMPRIRSQRSGPVIVFGGSMEVIFNQDAVKWFIESIFPLIKKEVPDVHFWIVGRNPPPHILKLARRPGIQVTGTVPDVRNFYAQADVFVIPLRLGGGIKLKTLEAMAMALPIVSTSEGVRGLAVRSGEHLYIADDPLLFAKRVVELLHDPNKSMEMGARARHLVEQLYSWDRIVNEVEDKLINLVKKRLEGKND
jgi:glycosyltransferase involved in cell wall biosynthesis